jgi:PHP-associated
MSVARRAAVVSVVLGVAIGSLLDLNAPASKAASAEHQVLAADFHVHTFFGDGALPPWEIAAEAKRRSLDVIAVTNHNQMVAARLGVWLVGRESGLLLLKGEEITAPNYHLVAIGISRSIGWRSSAADAIAAVHAQGGVAIAAHPVRKLDGYDARAMASLDGTEVAIPASYEEPRSVAKLVEFERRVKEHNPRAAPIGASDFHHRSPLGLCRTYVIVNERSEQAVLDAIRHGRTVAYDAEGHAFGEPALVQIVERHRATVPAPSRTHLIVNTLSVAMVLIGLLGVVTLA